MIVEELSKNIFVSQMLLTMEFPVKLRTMWSREQITRYKYRWNKFKLNQRLHPVSLDKIIINLLLLLFSAVKILYIVAIICSSHPIIETAL